MVDIMCATLETPLTKEEACKHIAFFMGYRDAFNPCDNEFEKCSQVNKYLSLDELVPVWNKMKLGNPEHYLVMEGAQAMMHAQSISYMSGENIFEAAAIATALRMVVLIHG